MRTAYRRPAGLVVLAASAAIALAACGGSSGGPHVASLAASSGNPSPSISVVKRISAKPVATSPRSKRDPTALLDEWATCMRSHGDPNQATPTVDANKVIHVSWNVATPGGIYGTNKGGQGNAGPGQYCRTYVDEAQTDLQGDELRQPPSQVQLVRFSQCMRANGVPDFPDPSNGGLSINRAAGGDLNPNNPVFQNASRLCAKKIGVPGFATGGSPRPGSIVFNGDASG